LQFFKPIRPVNINILYDNTGRPSGEADVEFECHEDAMRVSIQSSLYVNTV
jgi:RNA recognition motif-containing protein